MRKTTGVALSCLIGTALVTACGNGGGNGGSNAGGSASSSSGSPGTGGSSMSSSSGGGPVNGCTLASAEDHTSSNTLTITFGGSAGLTYSPACAKVKTGTMVTFSGAFTTHPLAGGNSPPTKDATSPIAETKTGTTATFTLSTAGTYGFFCEVHQSLGMQGALFVQ
jgi:plastocyanin